MIIDIATLFPKMCDNMLQESIIGRARKAKIIDINCYNIRDYSNDKHKRVDDYPYGGGNGMLMKAEPIYQCVESIKKKYLSNPYVVYMSPKGETLTQKISLEFSKMKNIIIICGHYEGIDERVIDKIVDRQISIGDYVLTGGELPAMVFVDSVCRLVPGVLSNEICFKDESYFDGRLEYPQYTRPEVWRGKAVPQVLLSGHHANIEKWKYQQSVIETQKKYIKTK